jgi:hypothetical protein
MSKIKLMTNLSIIIFQMHFPKNYQKIVIMKMSKLKTQIYFSKTNKYLHSHLSHLKIVLY